MLRAIFGTNEAAYPPQSSGATFKSQTGGRSASSSSLQPGHVTRCYQGGDTTGAGNIYDCCFDCSFSNQLELITSDNALVGVPVGVAK